MPYDPQTGIHSSPFRPVTLPPFPVSIFDFLFPDDNSRDVHSPALIDASSSRSYSYGQTRQRTLDLARAFHARGVREGDACVLFSPNDVDYGPVIWAANRQGAVVSCANPEYMPDELTHQLDTVHQAYPVKLVLSHPDSIDTAVKACEKSGLSPKIIVLIGAASNSNPLHSMFSTLDDIALDIKDATVPPKVTLGAGDASKLALLMFSSGTTGRSKAVRIANGAVIANVLQNTAHFKNSAMFTPFDSKTKKGDVVLGCLPLYHIYGLIVSLHTSVFIGLPVVVLPRFTFAGFLDAIQRHTVSILYVVPPIVIMLVKQALTEKYNLSSLRFAMTGAAPMTNDTLAAFRTKFPSIAIGQAYGATEVCTVFSSFPAILPSFLPSSVFPDGFPGASAGILIPNVEGKIVSLDGKLLGPNEVGELWARGPSNALGYLNNEQATKETFDDEGFVHTGDECKIDEYGLLYVVDRIKELIKSSGFQVAPAELEGHLLLLEDVLDVAIIGIPDERRGEVPKAFVVLTPPASARLKAGKTSEEELSKTICKHVTDHKIKYKALHPVVEFLDAIPKTPSGKLLRKDLRVLYAKKLETTKTKL